MIQIHEEKTINSSFIVAKVINGQVKTLALHTPLPMTPDGFELIVKDLYELRKVLWPGYVDASTSSLSFDVNKHKGVVHWFNDAKGFGFITEDGTKREIFVHFTSIQSDGFRTLAEGDRVQFEIEDGPKGLTARNVKREAP